MRLKAFTLIELLIVVAIIAILAAIAVPNFLEAQTRSKVSRTAADQRSIGLALEAYNVDNRAYPFDGANYPSVANGGVVYSPNSFCLRVDDKYLAGRYLTSPIAYIMDIPIDVFNTGLVDVTGYTPGNRLSTYYACKKFTTRDYSNDGYGPTGSQPWSSDKPFKERLKTSEWFLWSVGPSHHTGRNSTHDTPYEIPYDPTNGTVSIGGIWRLQSGTMY